MGFGDPLEEDVEVGEPVGMRGEHLFDYSRMQSWPDGPGANMFDVVERAEAISSRAMGERSRAYRAGRSSRNTPECLEVGC